MARGVHFHSRQKSGDYAYWEWTSTDWLNRYSHYFTICMWGRLDGAIGGSSTYGQCFLEARRDNNTLCQLAMDITDAASSSPWELRQFAGADNGQVVGFQTAMGDVVTASDQWFFATASSPGSPGSQVWYYAKDGDSSLTTIYTWNRSWSSGVPMDRLRLAWNNWSDEGANLTVTNLKIWKSTSSADKLSSSELLTEMKNESPQKSGCVGWYKLLNSDDLSNQISAGSPLPNFTEVQVGGGAVEDGTMNPSDIAGTATRRIFHIL